jgi:hypothetical protein
VLRQTGSGLGPQFPVPRDAGWLVLVGVVGLGSQRGQALLEMRREFLKFGFAVEVVHFVGIGDEVVEFPLLGLDKEVDELVTVSAYTVAGAHLHLARTADHHGNADRRLVHEALVVEMVLAKEEPVIGTKQDRRVVGDVLAFKLLPHGADVAFVILHAGVMVLNQFFERSRIVAEDLGVADLVVGIGNGARLARITFEIPVEVPGLGWGRR